MPLIVNNWVTPLFFHFSFSDSSLDQVWTKSKRFWQRRGFSERSAWIASVIYRQEDRLDYNR